MSQSFGALWDRVPGWMNPFVFLPTDGISLRVAFVLACLAFATALALVWLVGYYRRMLGIAWVQSKAAERAWKSIAQRYQTPADVTSLLRREGVDGIQVILGIDYTKSNELNGALCNAGRSLHHIVRDSPEISNPYQDAIRILGETLEPLLLRDSIAAYGFGDVRTRNKTVFPFYDGGECAKTFEQVVFRYRQITPLLLLSGPTNFAPLIYEALDLMDEDDGVVYVLIIIADGQVHDEYETREAIAEASDYPLSIIVVGVGDGPFDMMEGLVNPAAHTHYVDEITLDDLPPRGFANFSFVNLQAVLNEGNDAAVAMAALKDLPSQVSAMQKLQLIQ